MADSVNGFYQKILHKFRGNSKPVKEDLEVLCNHLDTWVQFCPDDNAGIKAAAMSTLAWYNEVPHLQSDDLMLRLYQILGKHSGVLGASGVFDQIEVQGRFRNSYKFHYLWAQYHAEVRNAQKFREIFQLTLRRIKGVPEGEIISDFKAIAGFLMPGLVHASVFGSVAAARSRRRSVAAARQDAMQNIAQSRVKSKISELKVELIDRDNYTALSFEEYNAMVYSDICGDPVDMEISADNSRADDDMEICDEDITPPTARTPIADHMRTVDYCSDSVNEKSPIKSSPAKHEPASPDSSSDDVGQETSPNGTTSSPQRTPVAEDSDPDESIVWMCTPPPPMQLEAAPMKIKQEVQTPVSKNTKAFLPGGNDSGYNFDDEPTLAGQRDGLNNNSDPRGIITSTPCGPSNRITHNEFFGGNDFFDSDGTILKLKRASIIKESVTQQCPKESQEIVGKTDLPETPKQEATLAIGNKWSNDEAIPVNTDLDSAGARPKEDICGDVNPWDCTVRNAIMAKHPVPTHQHEFKTTSPKIQKGKDVNLGGEVFQVKDLIGEGGFAKVFKCIAESGMVVALKFEAPSCAWEVYICDQLKRRLEINGQTALTKCVMEITDGFIFKNASLLVNEYHGKGTLLNVANHLRGSATSLLIVFIAIQIASVLKEVHRAGIVHGDVKPDNIMVLSKVDENASAEDLLATGVLKFIDWGRAIDIRSMPVKEFKGRAGTAAFDCPEMLKNMPWNYQTDFFGFVATMQLIIFGKYSKVQVDGRRNCMDQAMKRRLDCRTLMEGLFDDMLNMPSCSQLVDWEGVVTRMSNFFKSRFNQLDWRQAARAFNESSP